MAIHLIDANVWLSKVCLDPDLTYPPPKKKTSSIPSKEKKQVWRAQRAVDECKGKKQAANPTGLGFQGGGLEPFRWLLGLK